MEFGVLALASHLRHRLVGALQTLCPSAARVQVCQKHFAKVLDAPEAKAVRTQSQASLWLWRVHNEVRAAWSLRQGRSMLVSAHRSLVAVLLWLCPPYLE